MPRTTRKDADYQLHPDGRFVVRDYNRKKPFCDFLPGIAGLYGTPLWAFFVNRGQCLASFGTRTKDQAILEFFPANKAYQNTPHFGYRTFIKYSRSGGAGLYEPFTTAPGKVVEQSLQIRSHELSIEERDRAHGLRVRVRYYTVPGEPLAVLVRELEVHNVRGRTLEIELADGLPLVNPYGMNEFFIKNMSRTIEAWMTADNVAKKAPYLRLRVDATDRPEVTAIEEGNFFFGFDGATGKLLDPVVDPAVLFGPVLDFGVPEKFVDGTYRQALRSQVTQNKTPCAFTLAQFKIAPDETRRFVTLLGHARSTDELNAYVKKAVLSGYIEDRREENRRTVESVKSRIFTVSSDPVFDLYCGQTYLDNVLRGGVPVKFGEGGGGIIAHVYSRKHGDLERDYNRFLVEPAYFAQGDGNYRDVNQNRRNDVWFKPEVRDLNIRTFLNLLQLDGGNPLVIKGTAWALKDRAAAEPVLRHQLGPDGARAAVELLSSAVTLGELYRVLSTKGLTDKKSFGRLLDALAPYLERREKAEHGEGFWTDHWTYNLDLIESYLAIYPEDRRRLLFGGKDYTYFDDDHYVRPRAEKAYRKPGGEVRQYRAVARDEKKAALIRSRRSEPTVARQRHGEGEPYRTTLAAKLLCLFAVKYATLDASGRGIEMEADKPSWYDALNGLPGLFGSSMPESYELRRLALFLAAELRAQGGRLETAEEIADLIKALRSVTREWEAGAKPLELWEKASAAKETYRQSVRYGVDGKETALDAAELAAWLEASARRIAAGLDASVDPKSGVPVTYYEQRVLRQEPVKDTALPAIEGLERVRPLEFAPRALPLFLEGPVHAMKVERDPSKRLELYQAVRRSALYDRKLGMYKVNAPMAKESLELGRARVFLPGWLENESVWLHMEYKWLVELLRGGLEKQYYADAATALVPYQDPARYGRSPLQNSSFIASSALPDASLHGTGFVARLSGSTAEFLEMWLIMHAGPRPYRLDAKGRPELCLEPRLRGEAFTREETVREYYGEDGAITEMRIPRDAVAFLFLGSTLVTYVNPKRRDTYGPKGVRVVSTHFKYEGRDVRIEGGVIGSPYAEAVRAGKVQSILAELA
ncbi:MAG: hypothetical protein MOGMAGMI_01488 [Candidatus Omnitrophica bacterium]|nr:hypothetical protein [Candidatus Omnitrophota bacterium]